jgi:hypothetical protein
MTVFLVKQLPTSWHSPSSTDRALKVFVKVEATPDGGKSLYKKAYASVAPTTILSKVVQYLQPMSMTSFFAYYFLVKQFWMTVFLVKQLPTSWHSPSSTARALNPLFKLTHRQTVLNLCLEMSIPCQTLLEFWKKFSDITNSISLPTQCFKSSKLHRQNAQVAPRDVVYILTFLPSIHSI